ncbi:hypothetical protein [Nonomuraea endophytica]|uniref:Uncharacterized protein n=1 Tax=Nonomuraea endophytica TaxID=714136 RepID=A0A7W8A5U4_9ACTN|nr:hypothetical protein [Nonomuraea endophytica]MBB5080100.1 hypothetical protein [Nonomuraea endophytica]
MTEQVWTVAWWQSGWGVWQGEEPDLTTEPTYTTLNLPHVASEGATYWALGVIPHGSGSVRCQFGGDPDGMAKWETWIEEQRAIRRRRRRRLWLF